MRSVTPSQCFPATLTAVSGASNNSSDLAPLLSSAVRYDAGTRNAIIAGVLRHPGQPVFVGRSYIYPRIAPDNRVAGQGGKPQRRQDEIASNKHERCTPRERPREDP